MKRTLRWSVVILTMGLILTACASTGGEEIDDETTTTTATDTEAPPSTDGDDGGDTGSGDPFTLSIAIFEDLTTDNYWAYQDPESSVWNFYVFGSQVPAMFVYSLPNLSLIPQAASDLPAEPVDNGDGTWSVTQSIRADYAWSDGEQVDANDVVFTFESVRDLGLGGNWLLSYPIGADDDPATEENEASLGLVAVNAVDDKTVEYVFNGLPGLTTWQFGVGVGPIMPQHFWEPLMADVDSAEALYSISGEGSPTTGPYLYDGREPGAFATNVANDAYPFQGTTTRIYDDGTVELSGDGIDEQFYGEGSGEVANEYTEGPYANEVIYSVYTDQNAAVLALAEGDADYMLTSLGLQRGLQELIFAEEDLDIIVNPANAYRYLAFNMRRFPMSDLAFREAMACMIDKDFMANTVLAGSALPAWGQVPESNEFWYSDEVPRLCEGLTAEERLNFAVQTLKDAGFTWEVEPQWDPDNLDALPAGEGLVGPDGQEIPELELLAPGPGYDPLRATYALYVEDWARDLGIPLTAEPTGFNVIVDAVFSSPDADFDMYILGWTLTPFPNHLDNFFDSASDVTLGGNNTPGYNSPEYDALVDAFREATDVDTARDLVIQMDTKLAEDLPYVVLFTTPILEPYRTSLEFPFTQIVDGIQSAQGLPSFVQLAE